MELKSLAITEIIPSENWFMYGHEFNKTYCIRILASRNCYVWSLQLLIGLVREVRIAYSIFTHLILHGSAYFEVSRLIALVASW